MALKPQLADNWLEGKQRLPAWQQPKWDGVRGLHITGSFTGRSLKAFKNKALTAFWSQEPFAWLDGELVMPGATEDTVRLCSLTTGLCNRVKETAIPDLIAFDYLKPELIATGAPYRARYGELTELVGRLETKGVVAPGQLRLVENHEVYDMDRILTLDSEFLDRNLEGSILRNPDAPFKEGRPSGKVQELMRIKRFIDFEFLITGVFEAMENQNEAKTNELGRTERSTHQANMVAKGMIGGFEGELIADVVHNGKTLFPKGRKIIVGPGQTTHDERKRGWEDKSMFVGKIGKCATFPQGVKDKPRMPIFKSLRSEEDMSE